jgi:hypothetical protein
VYDREINGQEFTFGVSGKLIRNVLVMYDRQTNSLWSQLIGESIEGEMIGTKLEFVPSWMTTWEQWKGMHPNTLALRKGYSGIRDPYERGYYNSPDAGVIGETFSDDRLYTKEFVIGVELSGTAVAYPFSALNEQPLINDTIAGEELLIVFDKEGASGFVYNRVLGNQTLTFTAADESFEVKDDQTGSTWDVVTGEAIAGDLAGQQLERIKSTTVFWFGWKDFHPDTELYTLN